MEALMEKELGPAVPARSVGYVPALPTLWPHMLTGEPRPEAAATFPFDAPRLRYAYFARNAVWMAARVLGLEGAEVLVPAYHHGVEVEALIAAGCTPRFYRVDEEMRVDPFDVKLKITPRTRAVYLTHYAGFPGPTEALRRLCDQRGLKLIEDCALSLLSRDGTGALGRLGDASVFCFYKTLPVPHGGALVIGSSHPAGLPEPQQPPTLSTFRHLASSLLMNLELRAGAPGRWMRRSFQLMARASFSAKRHGHVATGTQHFNPEHSDLGMSPSAMRITFVQEFERIVAIRRRNFFLMLRRTRDLLRPVWPALPAGVCPLFFPLRLSRPDEVARRLADRGVETVPFWRVGHPSCDPNEFPEVRTLRQQILEVPIHQDISVEVCDALADVVVEAVREVGP